MREDIKELLEDRIEWELTYLPTISQGTDEHLKTIDGIVKLHNICYENEKEEPEVDEKQLRAQQIQSWIKIAIEASAIMAPLIFYGIWMKKGFKFEETGTISSKTFNGLSRWFKPTK